MRSTLLLLFLFVNLPILNRPVARPQAPMNRPSLPEVFQLKLTRNSKLEYGLDYAFEWLDRNPDKARRALQYVAAVLGKAYRMTGGRYEAYAIQFKLPGGIGCPNTPLALWAARTFENFNWLANFMHGITIRSDVMTWADKALSLYFSFPITNTLETGLQLDSCPLFN